MAGPHRQWAGYDLAYLGRISKACAITTFWVLAGVSITNDHLLEVTRIKGSSMAPTLSPQDQTTGARDRVLFTRLHPTLHMRRGDVVSFYAPHRVDHLVVKRVVALEGDVVHFDRARWRARFYGQGAGRGRLDPRVEAEIDEEMRRMASMGFAEEGPAGHGGEDGPKGTILLGEEEDGRGRDAVTVPPGHVWVEGDNWRVTRDSNFYGPISRSLIVGRAVCVIWPPSRFGERPWDAPAQRRTWVDRGTFEPLPRD